jgi:hypothetical protein
MFRGGEILRPFLSQRRPGPQAGLPADLSLGPGPGGKDRVCFLRGLERQNLRKRN